MLLFVATTLLARPKRTVLFLRRFGLDVNFVVSRTFERKLGAHFRLVTLDDERFPSRDLTALERWSIRIAPPLIALTILAIGVPVAADFSRHPGSNFAVGELSYEVQREVAFYVGMLWMAFIVFLGAHLGDEASIQAARENRTGTGRVAVGSS